MADPLNIYLAGDLFDHKHLIGNALLAKHIETVSEDRYRCVLPQNLEQGRNRKEDIRNQDLTKVMECDLGLFNFDGPDLDSGTVVEFLVAKMLDIPAVILRTDIRAAGDQEEEKDNWNLMCSFYPRTEVVRLNGISWYQEHRQQRETDWDVIQDIYIPLAGKVIQALDEARNQQPLASGDLIQQLYHWSTRFPGAGLQAYIDDKDWIENVLENKRRKGLIN